MTDTNRRAREESVAKKGKLDSLALLVLLVERVLMEMTVLKETLYVAQSTNHSD